MSTYYDLVLVAIPLALLGSVAVLPTAGLSLELGVGAGAIAAGAIMGHALFVRAPGVEQAESVDSRAGSAGHHGSDPEPAPGGSVHGD